MAAPPAMSEEVASFWRSVGMPIPATVPSPLVLPPPPLPPPLLPGAANGLDAVAAAAAVVERGMGGGLTAAAVDKKSATEDENQSVLTHSLTSHKSQVTRSQEDKKTR
eukprot:gene1457-1609_t